MFQSSPQGAPKVGPKPGIQNAVEANPTSDDQRMYVNRQPLVFDGKRMRKPVARKTIDYNSSVVRYLENRKWFKRLNSRHTIQPDESYATEVMPPSCMTDNPINAVTTKFVRTSTNKLRCPIFCVVWTPEGRRLVTGASSGEFTLWNGLTFNFETILTAHDLPVRSMVWSHNDSWLLSGDHGGVVKYWQSNMNNVQMYEAHKEPIRGLSFSPTDNKYASCADDGLVKIWDFYRCTEEKVLKGHGADVKCIDWHPQKSLLVSGSKDSQQPIKIWDTRTGNGLATLHLHKSTVMSIKWNQNGNWLLTASRDHLLKLFDIRMMKELQSFRGHKREATAIAWHPIHESLFASGGSDGAIMFWNAGVEKDVGNMESAHDGMVWSLAWHPLGHILCSGSNDHSSKFWTRNKLGDRMRDKYNLNMQDTEDDLGDDIIGASGLSANHTMAIPGMESTEPMEYDDGFDYASLPGFKGSHKANESDSRSVAEKSGIPGFGSSPKTTQLPPFAQPGMDMPPRFGPGFDPVRAPPFRPRGDVGFEMHHRPDNPGPRRKEEVERPWEPHEQPNMKFQPGPYPEELGPENWGPPRENPVDNRGTRGNEPRFGPGQEFQRDHRAPHFKRGTKNQGEMRDGILGSPPHGSPDMWSRGPSGGLGLLGPAPPLPGPPDSRLGILGPQPGAEQNQDHDMRRPGDRDDDERDVHEAHRIHPNDLSSRGFRRGTGRGAGMRRGHDPNRPQDQAEERNGETRPRGPPFQRGFNPNGRGAPQGPDDDRRPWQPSAEPSDPRFRRQDGPPDRRPFDRPPWDGPQDDFPPDDMGQPNHRGREFVPHDPRAGPHYGRGPPNDINPRGSDTERRHSDDSLRPQETKPRPLMSLMSLNPIVPPHNRNHEHDEPDRPPLHRKFSGEGEHDREWECPPQQKLRFPPPGPPEERLDNREGRPFPEEQIGWRGRGGMR